jgi:NADPH:quinone reductase-like Zn-dependent oxidoreductase
LLQQVFPVALPHVPNYDAAGVITEVGVGVRGWSVGDAVVAFLPPTAPGAAAEYVAAPAEVLAAAPRTGELADAAALPSVGLAAWQALFEHAGLQSGQRILINGAGGAVGGFAVQLAAQAGAHVIATASPRSAEAVRAAGADEIIDYTETKVSPDPVDVVLNLVRADEAAMVALVALVKPGGVLVSTTSPAQEDKDRKVKTISMYVRSDAKQLTEIADRVDAGTLKLDIGARYPLAEIAKVHERIAAGAIRGKVVIEI